MSRILFFVLLIVVIAAAWTLSRRRNALNNEERRELERLRGAEAERKGRNALSEGEPMVACDRCGTYFPKRDALHSGEHVYCSRFCRDQARAEAERK